MAGSVCPFCGLDPYEYVDVGLGSVAVAVTCCEMGYYLFDGGPEYHHCGMPMEEVMKIAAEMEAMAKENSTPAPEPETQFTASDIPF